MLYLRTHLVSILVILLVSCILLSTEFPDQNNLRINQRFLSVAQKNKNSQTNFSWVAPYHNILSWLYMHKFRIVGFSLAGGIIATQAFIWSLEYAIENQQWSAWNQGYSLEELQSLSDSVMQKELLRDIKRTYPCAKHDYATAFLAFLDALTQEQAEIETFQAITTALIKIPTLFFISYNTRLLAECPNRLAQISYLRNRLINSFIKEN